jgi:hypothetical protein
VHGYVLISGCSHSIKIDNSSFAIVEEFKYLVTTLTKQNSIQEEIKSGFKSVNAWCHSVKNLLSSSLLPKCLKIKIHSFCLLSCVGVKIGRSHLGRNVG